MNVDGVDLEDGKMGLPRQPADGGDVIVPGSLDGVVAVVLDAGGQEVASCRLDDERSVDDASGAVVGRVHGLFKEADALWGQVVAAPSR